MVFLTTEEKPRCHRGNLSVNLRGTSAFPPWLKKQCYLLPLNNLHRLKPYTILINRHHINTGIELCT